MIYCGDFEFEIGYLVLDFYVVVKGNCDFMGDFKDEFFLIVGLKKILVMYGYFYGIKQILLNVYYCVEEFGVDIICFGYLYIVGSEVLCGKLMINSGSIWFLRVCRIESYVILILENDVVIVCFYD